MTLRRLGDQPVSLTFPRFQFHVVFGTRVLGVSGYNATVSSDLNLMYRKGIPLTQSTSPTSKMFREPNSRIIAAFHRVCRSTLSICRSPDGLEVEQTVSNLCLHDKQFIQVLGINLINLPHVGSLAVVAGKMMVRNPRYPDISTKKTYSN
jgi:hypothetical protein